MCFTYCIFLFKYGTALHHFPIQGLCFPQCSDPETTICIIKTIKKGSTICYQNPKLDHANIFLRHLDTAIALGTLNGRLYQPEKESRYGGLVVISTGDFLLGDRSNGAQLAVDIA